MTAHTTMTLRRLLLMLVLVCSSRALAQSANEVLDASRAAIAEVSGFEAQFRMGGEGGSMFADTMPSMSGKLFFGTHDDLGRVIHAIGESKDKQTDPSKPLDMLLANDRWLWVDRAGQTINEIPRSGNTRGAPSSLTFVLIDSMISTDPFAKDANNAQSITLGAQEEVNGVLCDQVVIKRAEAAAKSRNSAESYTDVIWWIATQDKLPRRVHRITDAGLVKITLNFEISNLRIIEPTQEQLDIARPESFRFVSRMPKPKDMDQPEQPAQEEPINTEPSGRIDTPSEPEQTTPSAPGAPAFAFSTSDGASVNNATQQGRVTLLYFWGSWCAPCTQTSPLVNDLAGEINDPSLDVFALGMREGNPNQAAREFSNSYANARVSVNPEGIGAAFKIRVFPTIVVLDRDGVIAFQRSISRSLSIEQLVEEARKAVNDALGDA
jgi:thiol-disulfide isomerase/thioredoxin